MTTPQLRVERRTLGIYPYLFHAGSYYWPISADTVAALQSVVREAPAAFGDRLVAAVAPTRYLRHQLDVVLAGLDDREGEFRALQEALARL